MFFEIDYLVVDDGDAFGLEELLHEGGCGKVVAAGENAVTVHYAVGGHGWVLVVGRVHSPTYHA